MRSGSRGLVLLLGAALTCASAAQARGVDGPDLVGRASVIDGDTIEIRGRRIRLHGIDAPEGRQLCTTRLGRRWPCGRREANALAADIGASPVRCTPRDTDRYGRVVAVCRKGREDLNRWMVQKGWAVAYRRYGLDYAAEEDRAREARRGIWAGSFEMPWDWRAKERGR